jgi:archaellum component FlaF (FlaF/FlaG flagellin family)
VAELNVTEYLAASGNVTVEITFQNGGDRQTFTTRPVFVNGQRVATVPAVVEPQANRTVTQSLPTPGQSALTITVGALILSAVST